MPKTIPSALATHLAQETTTLCTCWIITRRDGTVLRFTDHDQNITIAAGGSPTAIEAGTYLSAVGYSASAVESKSDGSVDNMEVIALIDDASITVQALHAGLFDGAEVRVFACNWNAPNDGIVALKRGFFGEATVKNGCANVELRSLQQVLQQQIGRTYTPSCHWDFGDAATCKVNLLDHTRTGTVTRVSDRANFFGDSTLPDGSLITWTSGENSGTQMEVKRVQTVSGSPSESTISLYQAVPFQIQVGDTYSIQRLCDKTPGTCQNTYANIGNFGGFPDIPGVDKMLRYPDAP